MEKYVVNGKGYNVKPEDVPAFMKKYPNAQKHAPGKKFGPIGVTPTAGPKNMGSKSVIGSSAQQENKGWFKQALDAGRVNADLYDDADAVFDIGSMKDARNLSNKELQTYIDLVGKSKTTAEQMEELNKFTTAFQKHNNSGENWFMSTIMSVNENGGVFGGGMKGFAQSTIQSYRSMANKELAKEAVAPTLAAAGTGAAATAYGFGVGAIPAGFAGLFGSMNYGLETIHTFNELLEEEIKNANMEFTPDAIREIMGNDEIRARIKSKARLRGGTIGMVEGATNLIGIKGSAAVLKAGKGVTGVVGKTAVKGAAGITAATAEAVGGGTGEYLGGKFIGRDASGIDIVLESLSMGATKAPLDVTVAAIDLARNTPSYEIDGKKVSKKSILDYVNGAQTAEQINNLKVNIKNDNAFAKAINDKINNTILETQVDAKIEDASDRQRMVELEKQRLKAENDTKKKGVKIVPGAKENLERIEMQMNEIAGKYTAIDGRTKDVKTRKKKAQDIVRFKTEALIDKVNEANKKSGKKQIKTIKDLAAQVGEKTGLQINVESGNTKDFQKHLFSAQGNLEDQTFREGLLTGYQEVITDENSTNEEISEAKQYVEQLQSGALEEIPNIVKGEAKRYGRMAPVFDENGNVTSYDLFINNETAFKDGKINTAAHEFFHAAIFTTLKGNIQAQMVLGDALQRALQAKGAKLKPGSTINDQISRYNEGEGLGEEILAIVSENFNDIEINEGVVQGLRDMWRRFGQKYLPSKFGIKFDEDQDVLNFVKDYHKTIKSGNINKATIAVIAKGAEGKLLKDVDWSGPVVGGEMLSKEASDNVQRIYEEQGEAGAMGIIEEFKPITSRITERRREAPGFDKELLMSEIELGERGILDLIREYKPESGVPLAAYINKFLPSRAIEASRRVLGEEFTEDISERVDIAAEEAPIETPKRKKKKILISDRLRVENKVDAAVKKVFPSLNLKKLNFKTLQDLTPEITGGLFGINPKKLKTGANITKGELQSAQMFISKNADLLLAMLPEGTTMSGTSTGVQNVLLQSFYEKSDRVRAAKTGSKAGLPVQVKRSNISKVEFLEVFGIIDGKPVRTDRNTSSRVLALAKQTGKMMTNQAVRKILIANPDSPGHIVGLIEDGKSITMWAKSPGKDSGTIIENGKQEKFLEEREVGQELPELRLTIDELTALQKVNGKSIKPIDTNSKEGRKEYIMKMYSPVVVTNLPESIFRHSGTHTGTTEGFTKAGERAIDLSEGIAQEVRLKTRNLPYKNVQEMNSYVDEAKDALAKEGIEFAPPDKDIDNALTRTSFSKALKLLAQGKLKAHNESKVRGLKKIWKAFERIHAQDPELALQVIGGMMKSISATQGHFMRVASPIKFFNMLMGANVEEHTSPISFLGRYLFNRLAQGNLFDENNYFDNAVSATSFFQGQLPKIFDDRMAGDNYNYKENIPAEHLADVLSGKKSVWIRYFNKLVNNNGRNLKLGIVGGIDPNVMNLDTGKTIAQEFGVDVDVELTPMLIAKQQDLLAEYFAGEKTLAEIQSYMQNYARPKIDANAMPYMLLGEATIQMRSKQKKVKGITVLDFDDTLATTKSKVLFTTPDGTTGSLNAAEYASNYEDLVAQGYKFDFSEFNEVIGGKTAPLFNKALKLAGKFGTKNMFILTARPQASAKAIQTFLKANGLDIPMKNITGLGNSTAKAKALWIADKVADGYNDFYFADDALQNVQAVSNMLDQFDVKSKIQRAKAMFSKDANETFNDMLEDVSSIESEKRFSAAKARKRGEGKGKFRFFIPPSHEDFVGLLYNFLGKGEKGNKHRAFFEENLIKPLNRAYTELNAAKQSIANDYKNLIKEFPGMRKNLTKKTPDGDYLYSDAVRVYLWDKAGFEVPGMAKTDIQELTDLVKSNPELQAFADHIGLISREKDGYVKPTEEWEIGDIRTDLADATNKVGRQKFFTEFIENSDIIFSKENLNKIEAIYGANFREAIEDMLYRIKNGTNRRSGNNRLVNRFTDWINASVGSTMFLNIRSGVLQQLSMVNFINYGDNNIFKAAGAFANQLQYWKDYSMIFNSNFLKQRRTGIGFDVNGAELAQAVSKSKEPFRAAMRHLLQKGFILTQLGDSNAISMGGATFYRNRVNTYLKQGLSKKEAESKAWTDFQELAEMTQQSARPDMISQQQASPLGKLILAFQNTPSQYNRFGIKKPALDIINRRKTPPYGTQVQSDMSNLSRILYYGAIQNVIFYGLQSALFAMMFSDDEGDEEFFEKKKDRIINGSIDSILRGSGVFGAVLSTLKNTAIKIAEQKGKTYGGSTSVLINELLQLSPPIGIKARKLTSAEKTMKYNKKVIKEMETFDIDNPIWEAVTNVVEGVTNAPVNRLHKLVDNAREAMNPENEWWQRTFLALGWDKWGLGVEDREIEVIKKEIKDRNKKKKKKKIKSNFKPFKLKKLKL